MAQLVKLDDCHSRYEQDLTLYANRFIQLKNKRLAQWEEAWNDPSASTIPSIRKSARHSSSYDDFKNRFNKFMLEQKIMWATSTTDSISEVPENYLNESWFDFTLRAFSDMCFTFYKPTLEIQNGLTQLETVLVTPGAVWCLKGCYGEKESVFQEINDRSWQELTSNGIEKRLNPLISLKNTYKIVKALLTQANSPLPVHAALIVPESYVEFANYDRVTRIVDKRQLSDWLTHFILKQTTFKHEQLKATRYLLAKTHCIAQSRM